MRRRHLSAFALLVALFAGALGQAFASPRCPLMRRDHACCRARAARNSASHETACGASHEMSGGMRMTPAAESSAESNQGAKALAAAADFVGGVANTCEHCAARQSTPRPALTSGAAGVRNRSSELAPPRAATRLSELTPPHFTSSLSRDNSPPETSTARHVLVNVFRI
ncbi:MAG TPA: hypothetical protein VFA21_14675 [Pyrinomonadaceae bacterium]|jgi:hypothetical protein|nr:hypothetical protein [Pyrinomonadaceae bacterium]